MLHHRQVYPHPGYIHVNNSSHRDKAFYELFSRKECYIKKNTPIDIRKIDTLNPEEDMSYHSYDINDYSCVAYTSDKYETTFFLVEETDLTVSVRS